MAEGPYIYIKIPSHPVTCIGCGWNGTMDYLEMRLNEYDHYDLHCLSCGKMMFHTIAEKKDEESNGTSE